MIYVFLILLLLLAVSQGTILPAIPFIDIRPDLVLLLVLSWTMVRGTLEGSVGAFVGGLALDVLSPLPLGSHALAMLLIVVPVGWLGAPFYRGNLAFPITGAFLSTILYNLLLLALSRILGQGIAWGSMIWRIALPMALLEATLIPLTYWVLDRVDRRLHRRLTIG